MLIIKPIISMEPLMHKISMLDDEISMNTVQLRRLHDGLCGFNNTECNIYTSKFGYVDHGTMVSGMKKIYYAAITTIYKKQCQLAKKRRKYLKIDEMYRAYFGSGKMEKLPDDIIIYGICEYI